MLSNYVYKSQEAQGVHEMLGLNQLYPFADGLEPSPDANGVTGPINFINLHNISQQNIQKNDDLPSA